MLGIRNVVAAVGRETWSMVKDLWLWIVFSIVSAIALVIWIAWIPLTIVDKALVQIALSYHIKHGSFPPWYVIGKLTWWKVFLGFGDYIRERGVE